jgi:DUF971 family protein
MRCADHPSLRCLSTPGVSNAAMSTDDRLNDAHALDPADPRFRPVDLHLDRKTGLRIRWADGVEHFFPLVMLRKNCPCATCRTERDDAAGKPAGRSLTILPKGIERAAEVADASLVGNYAIHIAWADGHSTGIYDFRYLRSLA